MRFKTLLASSYMILTIPYDLQLSDKYSTISDYNIQQPLHTFISHVAAVLFSDFSET